MHRAKSFQAKLWLYFVAFAAILLSLLWILQTVFLQSFYNGMLAKNVRSAVRKIETASKSEDLPDLIDRLAYEDSLLVYITDEDGLIYYSSDSYKFSFRQADGRLGRPNPAWGGKPGRPGGSYRNLPEDYGHFLSVLRESSSGRTEYSSENRFVCGSVIDLPDGSSAVLYVSAGLGAVGAAAGIIRVQLLWVTLLSLLLAFVIAYRIAKRFSVPIGQLAEQAGMLGEDGYENPFQKGFCRELDDLNSALDETAGKLSDAKNYQKELLANVSHDLRTPLTMIKGYAEMIRDISWESEEQRTADTGIIIREADRLTELVNEILAYSRLQEAGLKIDFVPVDLSTLTEKITGRFAPLLERNGGTVEREITAGSVISGNPELLERAVYNLIDNAVRHTGESKKISVSLSGEKRIRLSVKDYGDGIAAEELPHIWEKYYTSRQRGQTGASGLGLSIVKQIATLHGASYGVESEPGKGSIFWLEFPRSIA